MLKLVLLPDLGAAPVQLSLWFAAPGETVFAGDRLVEVLMPGAAIEVASPATGRLLSWRAYPRDTLLPGQVLGMIDTGDLSET